MTEVTKASSAARKRMCPHCNTLNAVRTERADKEHVYGRCVSCKKQSKRKKF